MRDTGSYRAFLGHQRRPPFKLSLSWVFFLLLGKENILISQDSRQQPHPTCPGDLREAPRAFQALGRTVPTGVTHQHALTHVLAKYEFAAGGVRTVG